MAGRLTKIEDRRYEYEDEGSKARSKARRLKGSKARRLEQKGKGGRGTPRGYYLDTTTTTTT